MGMDEVDAMSLDDDALDDDAEQRVVVLDAGCC